MLRFTVVRCSSLMSSTYAIKSAEEVWFRYCYGAVPLRYGVLTFIDAYCVYMYMYVYIFRGPQCLKFQTVHLHVLRVVGYGYYVAPKECTCTWRSFMG